MFLGRPAVEQQWGRERLRRYLVTIGSGVKASQVASLVVLISQWCVGSADDLPIHMAYETHEPINWFAFTPTEALKHGFSGVSTDNHPMCFLSLWSYAFVLRVWQSNGTSCHWSSAAWGPVASPGDNGLTKRSRLAIWNVCSWKKHVCMILYIIYII